MVYQFNSSSPSDTCKSPQKESSCSTTNKASYTRRHHGRATTNFGGASPGSVSIFVGTLFYLWYLRYGSPGLPELAVLLAMPVAYYLSRYLVSGGHRVVREAPDPLPRVEAGRPPCRQAQARYLVMGGRSVVREAPAQLRRAGRGRRELQQRPPWK